MTTGQKGELSYKCQATVPVVAFQMRETDPENTQFVFGFENIARGEHERHLGHCLEVGVKLGEQLGLCELLELGCSTEKR